MKPEPPTNARWAVARFGAYMHYAVPRILQQAGALEQLYTDFYAGDLGTGWLTRVDKSKRGSLLNRMMGRYSPDLPREKIKSFPLMGLEYYLHQYLSTDIESRSATFLRGGDKFAKRVVQAGFGNAEAIYCFNTAALPILRAAKARGIFTAYEQTIAPRAYEELLLSEEQKRFPGYEKPRVRGPSTEATIEIERAEWALADMILCGSEFVKEGVTHSGGPTEKCVVVPYGVEKFVARAERKAHGGPLRVLSVGEAGIRKGLTYLAEAAESLGGKVECRWIGAVSLQPEARESVGRHVNLHGIVPHSQIANHFEWADVFCLPSICEGSATVIYEALMSGVPVVTTPNAGSIVRDGVDGLIVPIRSSEALAAALQRLHGDRNLLAQMALATADAMAEASLDGYGRRLRAALDLTGPGAQG